MEQTVISADTHMDIVWLPEDLFVSNAPDSLKDKMPRVVETAEGRIWKAENTSFGFVAAGALTAPTSRTSRGSRSGSTVWRRWDSSRMRMRVSSIPVLRSSGSRTRTPTGSWQR